MSRGWLLSSIALGLVLGLLFALYPYWDLEIASWFFDPRSGRFPLSFDREWSLVRRIANWVPVFLLLVPVLVLLRKIIFPGSAMPMPPSVVLFLISSFLAGPALTTNVLLKDNWGRPRPNQVQQFAGTDSFQPWWRPGGDCPDNCSFVSGEASHAFWTVAPASLAPPQYRPAALGAAVLFGASVGTMRVMFGRHFMSDVLFAGVITILIVVALRRLLLDPVRRNDARLEKGIERVSVVLHRWTGTALAGAGGTLATAGALLKETGRHLHKRIACL